MRVGRLTKAHGLKGAIKVELYTDDPGRRFVPGAVFTLQVPTSSPWHGKTLELIELKWFNSHAVAFFKDVPDRSAAEKLIKIRQPGRRSCGACECFGRSDRFGGKCRNIIRVGSRRCVQVF